LDMICHLLPPRLEAIDYDNPVFPWM
jgi:hypothetical protein